jgi:hypothetical protein
MGWKSIGHYLQVALGRKRLVAAGELADPVGPQLPPDVSLHVGLDVGGLREPLGALRALVRPSAGVAVDVRLEVDTLGKPPAAVRADLDHEVSIPGTR